MSHTFTPLDGAEAIAIYLGWYRESKDGERKPDVDRVYREHKAKRIDVTRHPESRQLSTTGERLQKRYAPNAA
jgi:hypothetical protein